MFGLDQTLLIRALNSTKQTYFPSYIGLRLIGEQLPKNNNDYLQHLVSRRLLAGDKWRFKSFDLYKSSYQSSRGIKHEYRKCLAPSPVTAIAESFILSLLAVEKAFSIPDRVYSYRWPKSNKSGASYEFFAQGYNQRNREIADALNLPNTVAVVTDIKSFYPSVQNEQILASLKSYLDNSNHNLSLWRDAIIEFYSQLIDASKNGIHIGPASAHVLGHLVLKNVDTELTNKYGGNYFRYVDDIVVVCSTADEGRVKQDIKECIERNGFELNSDKTIVITSDEWRHNILRSDVANEDNFRNFTSDLTVYLAYNPDNAESIKKMLSEAGLSIPVNKLLALSSYSRFRYFLSNIKSRFGVSRSLDLALFTKPEEFLNRGLDLKKTYESSLISLIQEPTQEVANLRRWQVQRARRVINTLFYLRSINEWSASDGAFEKWPELLEQRALSEALGSGTINPILPFYGRGPAAFSEIWLEHGKTSANFTTPQTINNAEIDALISLRLSGIISSETIQSIQLNNSRLYNIINSNTSSRTIPDLSYEDEFESLKLGTSEQEISALAQTRHSQSEGTALNALSLLSSEYRS